MTARAVPLPHGPVYFTPGQMLRARYEIGAEIGRGGSSVVYRAHDHTLGHDVAIKLLVPPPLGAELARERMRREVQAARELTHTHVVAVYDFVDEGPWSCVVMELVQGPDLEAHVRTAGPRWAGETARIGAEIAGALAAAHHHGVLHRDVKPSNILLDPAGTARLADFGSAKLHSTSTMTGTGAMVGTISFTPPEVFAGGRPDARSDIYALGMTLYFTLTGTFPEGGTAHHPPPAAEDGYHPQRIVPTVPTWLNNIVARATARSTQHRFPTAAAMQETLDTRADPGARGLSTQTECLLCHAPDPMRFGICPACGGDSTAPDTLLFVSPDSRRDHTRLHTTVHEVFGATLTAANVARVVQGDAALVALPHATADLARARLADLAITTRAVPAGRAWTALPLRFRLMVLAVAGSGVAAGWAGVSSFLVSGPIVAAALTFLGHRAMQRPVLTPNGAGVRLPPHVQPRVVRTLRALPDGPARRLLGEVVRVAYRLYRTPGDWTDSLDALVIHACGAAEQLDDIDVALASLERHSFPPSTSTPAGWLDALSRTEHARAGGVQRFLEAIAALARLNALTASFDDDVGRVFDELTAEMERQSQVQREARVELDRILATDQLA